MASRDSLSVDKPPTLSPQRLDNAPLQSRALPPIRTLRALGAPQPPEKVGSPGRPIKRNEPTEEIMNQVIDRRLFLANGGAGLAGAGLFRPGRALAADKPFRIALSNSYIGNKWRLEMENVFKAALQM